MIKTEWLTGGADLEDAKRIRYEVFTLEQGVPPELEFDELDKCAYHLVVYEGELPVATGRIVLDGDQALLGRIAVLKDHRSKGIGDFTVRMLIRRSFELGAHRQIVHSQAHAAMFYERLGFKRVGSQYMEAGMPHINMERTGDITGRCGMNKTAIMTDSNSGITQSQARELGLSVLPMPFVMDNESYFEDINLTQEDFYSKLMSDTDISTSQPSTGSVLEMWDGLLKDYDEVVHIPMSSGLSASCEAASVLAKEYNGKVQVVNNQRISITQRRSVLDALMLAKAGKNAEEIKNILERVRHDSSIYIMVDTLKYLKKGGRITPAAAAIGSVLHIKPVLQIQGDKLDSYAKARGIKQASKIMIEAMRNDFSTRFSGMSDPEHMWLMIAYTYDKKAAAYFKREVEQAFPGFDIHMDPLSLSVSCHIGPGALAIACAKKIQLDLPMQA